MGVCAFQLVYSFTDWQPFMNYYDQAAKLAETRYVAGWAVRRCVQVTFGGPSALCNVVCPAAVVWFVFALEKRRGWVLKIVTALALIATAALTISFSLIIGLYCAAACILFAVLVGTLKRTGKAFRSGLAIPLVLVGVGLVNVRIGSVDSDAGLTTAGRVGSESFVYSSHLDIPSVATGLWGGGSKSSGGGASRRTRRSTTGSL